MFDLADELVTAAQASVGETTAGPTLVRFDVAQLVRGINAVKAAALLLEHSHWEFASGVARQLFEQFVHMEYLAAQPDRLLTAGLDGGRRRQRGLMVLLVRVLCRSGLAVGGATSG